MKIKTRMLVFIALPILMAILLIAGSSYVYSSRMVENLSKSEMLETAKKYGSNLETFIAKQIANVDMLSDSITMFSLRSATIFFIQYLLQFFLWLIRYDTCLSCS